MDQRSWLFRRKSSERNPNGETESSESLSSHSETVSDERALPNHNVHSPEVTSKPAPTYDELRSSVKILSSKLSEALHNIVAKEELVKQHAKVAEEAVSGWEKAESEVLMLKKQLDIITEKNSALEEHVGHVDGALKECLRQLRQAREEQEQKVNEAIAQQNCQWESTRLELENQIMDLHSLLETAKAESVSSTIPDLCIKLEACEKVNSELRLQLLSRDEEMKLRTSERDLSTLAAETASKQYLESIKKVAKLEAECRKLKMLAHRAASVNDHHPATASSVYVESYTNSQSDCGEGLSMIGDEICKFNGLEPDQCEPGHTNVCPSHMKSEIDQFSNEKDLTKHFRGPAHGIDLMDDFLEMERFAALPDEKEKSPPGGQSGDKYTKADFEILTRRTAELEERLEAEKEKLKMDLCDCEDNLMTSKDQLEEVMLKLIELQSQLVVASKARRAAEAEVEEVKAMLKKSSEDLQKAEVSVVELQNLLTKVNEAKTSTEVDLQVSNEKLVKLSKCLEDAETKLAEHRKQLCSANASKCDIEAELSSAKVDKEVAESQLKVVEAKNQTLQIKVSKLEEDIQKEQTLLVEALAKCEKLVWFNQDKELAAAANHKFAECQKTIASLGRQLKLLAAWEDLLIESELSPHIIE